MEKKHTAKRFHTYERNRIQDEIDLKAQLSDLKEIDYRNTLAIAAVIEVLLDKKIITREDIAKKAKTLDLFAYEESQFKTIE